MIKAVLFDLCSTLIRTEQLQALSYAWAALELRPSLLEEDVIEACGKSAGRPCQETTEALMLRFDLKGEARQQMPEWRAHHPWQAFARLRYQYYQAMLESPDALRKHLRAPIRPLLSQLREQECKVGLVTMTNYTEAWRILGSIRLKDAFDLVVARDDVERGKPDPEIYLLAAQLLELAPPQCLIVEGTMGGVRAALAAGTRVLAVLTPATRRHLADTDLLATCSVVASHDELAEGLIRVLKADGDGSKLITDNL
jgi:HAD superfamily hydrolase (TIGR01509 family)